MVSAMKAPANKLAIKFPNEAFFYFPLFKIIKLKIVRLTTINIVSAFTKKNIINIPVKKFKINFDMIILRDKVKYKNYLMCN
jgi:hypothetical protein